jgi:signal recognition particle GTPase
MTPDSSPPPSHPDSSMEKSNDPGISEAMLKEEEAIRKRMDKEEKAHDAKMAKERSNLVKQGSGAVDKKFKALEYLLNQSKVCCRFCCVSNHCG